MNAGTVFRVLSLIPERSVRAQSGTAFLIEGASCRHPDRFSLLSRFLHWMTPLEAVSKDDQRSLGLLSANGRPVQAVMEEDDSDLEKETEAV